MPSETDKGNWRKVTATMPEMQDAVLVETADHGTRSRASRGEGIEAKEAVQVSSRARKQPPPIREGKNCAPGGTVQKEAKRDA